MTRKEWIQARVSPRLYIMIDEIHKTLGGSFTEALEYVLRRYHDELYLEDITKLRKLLSATRWEMFRQEAKREK